MKKMMLIAALALGCGGRSGEWPVEKPREATTSYKQLIASNFNGIHEGEDLIIAKLPAANICVDIYNGSSSVLQGESWHVVPVPVSIPNVTGRRECMNFSGGILKVVSTQTIEGPITVQITEPKI